MALLPSEYSNASNHDSAETVTEASTNTDSESNIEDGNEINLEKNDELVTESEVDSIEDIGYPDLISEEYFYSDLPIVFTATRLEQPVSETPVSMTIIDKEMIEASGALEIAELMRLVPGMQVANYGGDEYLVTYHGRADLYSRSLQVLVDGRSIYNPVIGGVSWSDLPLAMEDIERIEVIRGSNAAAFGSNSFSGVINIITENPANQNGTLIKTTIGDKNTRQILARNAGEIGDLDYRLTINYDEKDGFKTRYDDATNKWFSFRGEYKLDSSNALSFQTGYSKGTQQAGYQEHRWNVPRDTDSTSSFQQVKWVHTEGKDTEYSLHFFHNYKELDDTYSFNYSGFDLVGGFSYESDRYELEFQHKLKPSSDLRMAWGVGLRHDSATSFDTLYDDSATVRNQIHAFLNTEWKPRDDLTVNFGAMLEKYEGFTKLFSPRVALNYFLKENHIFRISHSRAYRMPNVWEEQLDMRFRDTVTGIPLYTLHQTLDVPDPEEIDSIELGYMAALKDIPLTFDVKLFREHISPVINYAWDSGYRIGTFNNDGKIDINGVELQLDYQPTKNTNIHFVYSHLHASGWQADRYLNGQPIEYTDASMFVPKEIYGLLASHRFDNGVTVSSGFYQTDEMKWLDPGEKIDPYNKWDLRVGKTYTLPDATIDVSAIVHNVTDTDYEEYYNINKAQREIYFQVGIKF
jgi:iron complex outermembrane receptor protein